MEHPKKLYRSRKHRIIAGICGGIAEYLDVDPNVVRLIWIFFIFAGGAGVLAYIAAYFLIPEQPISLPICSNCGEENRLDAVYCYRCGNKLDNESVETDIN